MAESSFDRRACAALLGTRVLGRTLEAHASLASTNDEAWARLAAGAAHGLAIVADEQPQGRGRAGRAWSLAPGRGLALSVVLAGAPAADAGVVPLVAGLAVARGLDRLGAAPELKWPNDVLVDGRKLAGILCESRAAGAADLRDVVVGIGVNVAEQASDFPPAVRAQATSLALAGVTTTREAVAAALLDALEPLWDELLRAGRAPLIGAWRARATFWGREVAVRTASGWTRGIARTLDGDGRLVLETADGSPCVVLAGDVELAPERASDPA